MLLKKKYLRFILILISILLAATPAMADPISTTIASLAAWLTAQSVAIIGTSLLAAEIAYDVFVVAIYASLAIGLSYLQKALSPTRKTSDLATNQAGQTIRTGGVLPRSFIVGKFETPGKLVYVNTWGQIDKTPNSYLTMAVALSDIPISGVTGLLVSDARVTFTQATTGTLADDAGSTIPEYYANDPSPSGPGKDHLWVKVHFGTQTLSDTYLTIKWASDPSYPWDTTRVGHGVAYAVVTMLNDTALYPSVPTFKFEIQGIPLYDQRKDSTQGGSGTHRFNDKSTWEYTENPVVIINNILRGITDSDGNWMFGLQGMDPSRLPADTWFAAANECDALVLNNAGQQEAQYRCGSEISLDLQPADVIDELLKSCNGRLAEVGGIYKIHVGAADSSILSFTDDDIIITEQQSYVPFPSQQNITNGITANYPEPSQGWAMTDAPARYNPDLEADDGGRRTVSIGYNMVPHLEQVQRLMQSALLEARKFRQHTLVLPPECWILEPNDIVSYSSVRNGYVNKLFRVVAVTDSDNLDILVLLSECDPADYNWVTGSDFLSRVDGPLLIAAPPAAQTIPTWAVGHTIITGDNGAQRPAITLSWDAAIEDVIGIQYQVRLASNNSVVLDSSTSSWDIGTTTISEGILPHTVYGVRGRYIPRSARETAWSSWLSVTTDNILLAGVDIGTFSIDFDHFTSEIRAAQLELADQQREVMNEISLLTNGITQAHLGTYQDVQTINTTISSQYTTITAQYTSAIVVATGPGSSIATSITLLTAALNGYTGSNAVSTAFTSLTASVTSINGTLTSQASSITSLQSALSGYTGASAVSTAFSSLQTQVTTNGTNISANSSSITSLTSALTGYTGASAVSTAFSSLNSSVSSINGTLSSHSSSITSLTSSVGRVDASAYFIVETTAAPAGADSRIILASSASSGGSRVGAALYIDAMSGGTSRVAIEANSFYFVDPSSGPTALFSISGGVAYFNAPLNVGLINATNIIANDIIVTSHIQNNAITKQFAYTAGSTGSVASGTAVILGGDDLSVDYSGYVAIIQFVGSITRQGGHSPVLSVQIFRDSGSGGAEVDIGPAYQAGGSGIPLVQTVSAIAIDTVPGSNGYYRVKVTTDDGSTFTSNESGLIINVYKK